MRQSETGSKALMQTWMLLNGWYLLRSLILVFIFLRISRISSLKLSSKQKVRQAGSMVERDWDCLSVVVLQSCLAVLLNWKARSEEAAPLLCFSLLKIRWGFQTKDKDPGLTRRLNWEISITSSVPCESRRKPVIQI